ncbi:hypothetical protein GJ496_011457 [Pomphorhynchus laevis]|nr:hypothetical protein GJ496_011457 [Pomphorhynchus laevis]
MSISLLVASNFYMESYKTFDLMPDTETPHLHSNRTIDLENQSRSKKIARKQNNSKAGFSNQAIHQRILENAISEKGQAYELVRLLESAQAEANSFTLSTDKSDQHTINELSSTNGDYFDSTHYKIIRIP